MPIYMDLHIVPGVSAKDVAEAHRMDVLLEKNHQCKCLTYWIDELRGHVFCLIDAPDKNSVISLHNKSHGLIPHKIIEVQASIVESFLGRINDPENITRTDTGLPLIQDSSYRIIMAVRLPHPLILSQHYSQSRSKEILSTTRTTLSEEIKALGGREIASQGNTYTASFIVAEKAVNCAAKLIQHKAWQAVAPFANISIHAGEPVDPSEQLFGSTRQLLYRLNFLQKPNHICITGDLKQLLSAAFYEQQQSCLYCLTDQELQWFTSFFTLLDSHYTDPLFSIENYAIETGSSSSRFYRHITQLTGVSPNKFLKDYRLEKAMELINKRGTNISGIAFDTGFASPSYFTKCFRKKYGVAPLAYFNQLQ